MQLYYQNFNTFIQNPLIFLNKAYKRKDMDLIYHFVGTYFHRIMQRKLKSYKVENIVENWGT